MPRDPAIDDFLKSIGRSGGPSEQPSDDSAAKAAPAKASSADDSDWTWRGALDPTPVAKGLVGELGSAAGYIPGIKDSETLRSVRDWAESGRDEETGGGIKRFIGESLPFMAIPELGFGTRLGTLAAKYFPRTMRVTAANLPKFAGQVTRSGAPVRAGQIAANPSRVANAVRNAAPAVGTIGERAAIGAAAGSFADTNHPLEGAALGALGGGLPTGLSRLAQSRITQYLASHYGRHAAGMLASGAAFHLSGPFAGMIAFPAVARGPVGRGINRGMHYLMNRYGQIIGSVPDYVARAMAAGAGTAAGELFADQPAAGANELPGAAPLPAPEPAAPQEAAQ